MIFFFFFGCEILIFFALWRIRCSGGLQFYLCHILSFHTCLDLFLGLVFYSFSVVYWSLYQWTIVIINYLFDKTGLFNYFWRRVLAVFIPLLFHSNKESLYQRWWKIPGHDFDYIFEINLCWPWSLAFKYIARSVVVGVCILVHEWAGL